MTTSADIWCRWNQVGRPKRRKHNLSKLGKRHTSNVLYLLFLSPCTSPSSLTSECLLLQKVAFIVSSFFSTEDYKTRNETAVWTEYDAVWLLFSKILHKNSLGLIQYSLAEDDSLHQQLRYIKTTTTACSLEASPTCLTRMLRIVLMTALIL